MCLQRFTVINYSINDLLRSDAIYTDLYKQLSLNLVYTDLYTIGELNNTKLYVIRYDCRRLSIVIVATSASFNVYVKI